MPGPRATSFRTRPSSQLDGAQLHARDPQAAARRHCAGSRAARRSPPACPTTRCRSSRSSSRRRDATFNTAQLSSHLAELFGAHFGADRVVATKPIMAGEDFSRYWLADTSKQSTIFWVGGVPQAKWDAAGGDKTQTAVAAQSLLGARCGNGDLDRDRSDDRRGAGCAEEELGRLASRSPRRGRRSGRGVSFKLHRRGQLLQLLDAGRAGDRRGDRRLRHQPGQRDRRERRAGFRRRPRRAPPAPGVPCLRDSRAMRSPRGLLARSASLRYLPVRKPLARL